MISGLVMPAFALFYSQIFSVNILIFNTACIFGFANRA